MYYFILKKDLSNNDTNSLIIKQNGDGRMHTYGDVENYLIEMEDDNTIHLDKIMNTCYVIFDSFHLKKILNFLNCIKFLIKITRVIIYLMIPVNILLLDLILKKRKIIRPAKTWKCIKI